MPTTALVQTKTAERFVSRFLTAHVGPQPSPQGLNTDRVYGHSKSRSEPNAYVSERWPKGAHDESTARGISRVHSAPRSTTQEIQLPSTVFQDSSGTLGLFNWAPQDMSRHQRPGNDLSPGVSSSAGGNVSRRVSESSAVQDEADERTGTTELPKESSKTLPKPSWTGNNMVESTSEMPGHHPILNLHVDDGLQVDLKNDSYENPTEFMSEWSQLYKKRLFQSGLKNRLRATREDLQRKASAKAAAEDRLFQMVRNKELGLATQPVDEDSTILHLLSKYEQARNEFDPVEDDFRICEDQLDAEETELERLERELYARWSLAQDHSPIEQPASPFPDLQSGTSEIAEEDFDVSYDPRVVEYLSKLGDLDIVQERLDDLLDEEENLEEQRQLRARMGINLGPEEQTWLENSRGLIEEAEAEMKTLQDDVEVLKRECIERRLIDEYGEPLSLERREQEIFKNETDLQSGSQLSQYSRNPILLPKPLLDRSQWHDEATDPLNERFTLGGVVNKWMLDRLRTSALEVNLLARTYDDKAKGKESGESWQLSVLRLWYQDGTVEVVARTSTTRGPGSYFSDNPVKFANANFDTGPESMVQIRIWTSLTPEIENRVNDDDQDNEIQATSATEILPTGVTRNNV